MIVSTLFRLLPALAIVVSALLVPAQATPTEADYVWHFGDGDTSVQPDPNTSTFGDHLGRSPRNGAVAPAHQYTFHGVLRLTDGTPVVNYPAAMVDLIITSPCQNPVTFNPDAPSNYLGEFFWGPQTPTPGGGTCAGSATGEIRAMSQLFTTPNFVTRRDQDGDGLVALNDLQAWQAAFVTQSPMYQGDLDFDGQIALGDLSRWQNHFVAP